MADTVRCGDCGAPMALRQGPHRPFYGCTRFPDCRGAHGAHPDGTPMGVPVDGATRQARKAAHGAFDRLWSRDRKGSRGAAYRWLAAQLGQTSVHIGQLDADGCARVVAACNARGGDHG